MQDSPLPVLHLSRKQRRGAPATREVEFPMLSLSDPQGRVERCHNLRPVRKGGGLEGVGRPDDLFDELLPGAYFVPGGVFSHPDGSESILLCCDETLYVSRGSEPLALGEIGAEANVAVAMTDGWTVMTGAGAVRVRLANGVWGIEFTEADLPRLMFERLDGTTFTGDTAKLTSTTTFSTSIPRPLSDDARSIGLFLTDTYHTIASLARDSRQYIQPVIARYRLIGDGGRVLYTSAPVMISPSGGLQLAQVDLPLSGSPCHTIESTEVSARGFTIGLRATCSPSLLTGSPVKRVEIQVAPELHPLVAGEPCHCRVVSKGSGQLAIRAHLPGLTEWKRPGERGGAMYDRVARLLANLDKMMLTVASAPLPTVAGGTIQVCPYPDSSLPIAGEVARFRRVTGAASSVPSAGADVTALLRPPHSFTARAGARCGDVVLWGGIVSRPFAGYSLDELTVGSSLLTGGATPAAVAVKMDDGTVAVRDTVMAGLSPEAVSPLLVYPSGAARSLTVITPGSRTVWQLDPVAGGSMSFRLDPDLAPAALAEGNSEGFAVPVFTITGSPWPDLLAIASASAPLSPAGVARTGGGAVSAVTPVPGGSSSLDMTRVKFYAFSTGGVSLVTCRPGGIASLSVMDRRGVASPACVAVTRAGVAALLGGSPVMLAGGRLRPIGPEGLTGDAIGWNSRRDELWIFTDGSLSATVTDMAGGGLHTRTVEHTVSLLTAPSGLLMLTAAGHAVDASREVDTNVRCEYRVRVPSPCRPGLFYRLVVRLRGNLFGDGIMMWADTGTPFPEASPLVRTQFAGLIVHPFMGGFHAVHSHYLTLGVVGVTPSPSQLLLK